MALKQKLSQNRNPDHDHLAVAADPDEQRTWAALVDTNGEYARELKLGKLQRHGLLSLPGKPKISPSSSCGLELSSCD